MENNEKLIEEASIAFWATIFGGLEGDSVPGEVTRGMRAALAVFEKARAVLPSEAEAWRRGHASGRDYQGDGWNSDVHDPEIDNPYREAQNV